MNENHVILAVLFVGVAVCLAGVVSNKKGGLYHGHTVTNLEPQDTTYEGSGGDFGDNNTGGDGWMSGGIY